MMKKTVKLNKDKEIRKLIRKLLEKHLIKLFFVYF